MEDRMKEARRKRYDDCLSQYGRRAVHWAVGCISNKTEAEDIACEAFVRLWEHLDRITPGREGAWLYTTIEHLCGETRRKTQRMPVKSLEQITELGHSIKDPRPGPSEIIEERTKFEALEECVEQLPTIYQTVILRHLKGFTVRDVSELLGIALGTVKYRRFIALRKLQICLEGKGFSL